MCVEPDCGVRTSSFFLILASSLWRAWHRTDPPGLHMCLSSSFLCLRWGGQVTLRPEASVTYSSDFITIPEPGSSERLVPAPLAHSLPEKWHLCWMLKEDLLSPFLHPHRSCWGRGQWNSLEFNITYLSLHYTTALCIEPHTWNPSTQKAGTGKLPTFQGMPELQTFFKMGGVLNWYYCHCGFNDKSSWSCLRHLNTWTQLVLFDERGVAMTEGLWGSSHDGRAVGQALMFQSCTPFPVHTLCSQRQVLYFAAKDSNPSETVSPNKLLKVALIMVFLSKQWRNNWSRLLND